MDEPASLSHLAHVIEALVVVTPHGRGHEGGGKDRCPELKAAPVKTEILAGSIFGLLNFLVEHAVMKSCDKTYSA